MKRAKNKKETSKEGKNKRCEELRSIEIRPAGRFPFLEGRNIHVLLLIDIVDDLEK